MVFTDPIPNMFIVPGPMVDSKPRLYIYINNIYDIFLQYIIYIYYRKIVQVN